MKGFDSNDRITDYLFFIAILLLLFTSPPSSKPKKDCESHTISTKEIK